MTARGASLLALAFVVGALGGTGGARGQGVPAELGMRRVPASRMVPFYGGSPETPARVEAFDIDAHPVTNAQFLAFVSKTPRYRRGTVAPLFADAGYLRHWRGPLSLGENAQPEQPVVHVSWFTARAYCASRDARLPTELEWEVAARADETRADASRDPAYVRRILDWYGSRRAGLRPVGQGTPNLFGLYDLHGLVWEWVEDFNASMVSADDRSRDDDQAKRFCGGAAAGSADPTDYAAFMRYAFRSSLRASYTVHNLGFRCARSVE